MGGLHCKSNHWCAAAYVCKEPGVAFETKIGRRRDRGTDMNIVVPELFAALIFTLIRKCAEAHSMSTPMQPSSKGTTRVKENIALGHTGTNDMCTMPPHLGDIGVWGYRLAPPSTSLPSRAPVLNQAPCVCLVTTLPG